MKRYKKGIACSLTFFMIANASLPVFAAENSDAKEEVIYITTQADGTAEHVDVVNIFPGGNITDYGDYTSVKMLTTTDAIHQTGDQVTFSSSAEKVYYQGTLEDPEIPWNISIRYFLDGKEYTAEELAGQSGALEIQLSITENKDCEGSYYDEYALQSTFTLDTNLCDHIKAEGATEANVGSDKQLIYTILPGKGLKTSIYADVKDFEMDAVTINGMKLNLNMELDEEELTEKVAELMRATAQLDDGANALYEGSETLKSGGRSLDTGIASLESGVGELDDGITTLQNGMETMQTGIATLDSQSSTLKNGSAQIKDGIGGLSEGIDTLKSNLGYAQYKSALSQNGLDLDSLQSNNQQTITACTNQIAALNQTISALETQGADESQITVLRQQVENLENIKQLLSANSAAIGGTETYLNTVSSGVDELSSGVTALGTAYDKYDTGLSSYTNGVSAVADGYDEVLSGVSSLAAGSKELLNGSDQLSSGSSDLYDGIVTLCDGAKELKDGTSTLNSETSNMDTEVQNEIDQLLASIEGDKTKTISFVSEKNTNVESVQFVIKTSAIEKTEADPAKSETAESTSWWQKLLQLFGVTI